MARTRQSLKSVSVLCLALLVYAALPHFHAGHGERFSAEMDRAAAAERAGISAPPAAGGPCAATPADSPALRADEAHETHSSSASLESEPCTLCRNVAARGLEPIPATLPRVALDERSPCPPALAAKRPARLLAARHPARAPPQA